MNAILKLVIILVGGGLFGLGLAISGMTNPAKVIGFLDLFGSWDPTLAFVMGGALVTFGLGLLVLRKKIGEICQLDLPDTSSDPIDRRMVIGSIIFGIGWGISGFCPGPALANLVAVRTEALCFVPMMLLGMILSQMLLKLDQ